MMVLFTCYGGGHVEMVLPVMRALRAFPGAPTQKTGRNLTGKRAINYRSRGFLQKTAPEDVASGDKPASGKDLRLWLVAVN